MTVLSEVPADGLPCDVCIVGTGPAGIALALECERHGLRVLALEAGGRKDQGRIRGSETEIVTPAHHAPLHITTRSAFGGTSWGWSGLCTRFDDIDFEVREHIPDSGWPFAHDELARHYERAAAILNCRMDHILPVDESWQGLDGVELENRLYTSAQPRLGMSHWDHFAQSRAVTVCLDSAVVGLDLGAEGNRVETVAVRSGGRVVVLRPPRVVLAGGGLRSTQLLLATQRRWPGHFGGVDGVLGRHYMGHLTGWISSIRFGNPADAAYFKPMNVDGAKSVQRRFSITPQVQRAEGLQNIVLWAGARALYDPMHADGTLSAAYLALATPGIGALLLSPPLRRASLGPTPRRYMPHLMNIVRAPLRSARGAAMAAGSKIRAQQALSQWPSQDPSLAFLLTYHAEAAPNRESRVTLGEGTDSFGLPRLRIDLRFSDSDIQSTVRAHLLLDRALRQSGKAHLEYLAPPEELGARALEQATDGYHQLGLTRMGTDPTESIVDPSCRVHGLDNLFIASGSVFPTSGQGNPTLLTAALAVRLARHLAALPRGEQPRA
jgi:glycine/D-amino acid oxidase-like deaminating enzyme